MEPVPSILSAIFKVLQQIATAEREARRNRTRCRGLAERARVVSNFVRDAGKKPGSKNDAAAATRQMILRRLRDALDDALKLIESSGQRDDSSGGCVWPWVTSRLSSGARAARFDDVDKRINNCLIEFNAASGASIEKKMDRFVSSGRGHHQGTNKKNKAGSAPQKGATGKGGENEGKGSNKRKGKRKKNAAASGSRPPPPPPAAHAAVCFHQSGHVCTTYRPHCHSVEEDPNSCKVM